MPTMRVSSGNPRRGCSHSSPLSHWSHGMVFSRQPCWQDRHGSPRVSSHFWAGHLGKAEAKLSKVLLKTVFVKDANRLFGWRYRCETGKLQKTAAACSQSTVYIPLITKVITIDAFESNRCMIVFKSSLLSATVAQMKVCYRIRSSFVTDMSRITSSLDSGPPFRGSAIPEVR